MVRKGFAALAALVLVAVLSTPATAAAAPQVRVQVAGQDLVSDVAPFIENGRTLVPVRALAERLGFDVKWVPEEQKVQLSKWPREVELTIGSDTAVVNGRTVKLDVPARIVNNRTVVPLRFVSESLGARVSWDQATRTAAIQPPAPEEEQAWELLHKSTQFQSPSDGSKVTGQVTVQITLPEGVEEEPMPPISMSIEGQAYREDVLTTVQVVTPDGTFTGQTALYQGQSWINVDGQGWFRVELGLLEDTLGLPGLPADFLEDPAALTQWGQQILADAKAVVAGEEVVNGKNTFVVNLDLTDSSMLTDLMGAVPEDTGDLSLDQMQMTMWVDSEGFTPKFALAMAISVTNPLVGTVRVSATGEFQIELTDEPVIFPEALLSAVGRQPAGEPPALEPPMPEAPEAAE